ncbi:MAG TPA: hypothetical protein VGN06_13555 [Gaiellaceae bacterium]
MKRVWVFLFCAAVLAGCGGSSTGGGKHSVVVPAYGEHPATTVSAAPSPAACAADARIIARDAVALVEHSTGTTAYPADLYYTIIREDLADFEARSCEADLLGPPLRARLTPKQRAVLVDALPRTLAAVIRAGLATAS